MALVEKTKRDTTLLRFVIVGFGANILNWALWNVFRYFLLKFSGLDFSDVSAVANIPATLLTYIFSFSINKHFTFGQKTKKNNEILKFALISLCSFLVATLILKTLTLLNSQDVFIVNQIIYIIGVLAGFIINYLGQKYWVFKN
jgi:putative flippase GtrA